MAFVEKSAGHNWHTVLLWIQVRKKLSSRLTIWNLDSNLDFDLKQHSQAYFGLFLVRRIRRFNFWPKIISVRREHANHGQTWLKIQSGLRLYRWRRRRLWWRSRSRSTPPPPPPPRSALSLLTFAWGPHHRFPAGVKKINNNPTWWTIDTQFRVCSTTSLSQMVWFTLSSSKSDS